MNWEAYELHCVNSKHDTFYRVIRSGHTLVTRFGRLGSTGQRLVKTLGHEADAHNLAVIQRVDKINKNHYREVYRDEFWEQGSGFEMDPLPMSVEEIEQMFLDRWQSTAVRGLTGGPKQWVVVADLVRLGLVDLTARFVFEKIKAGPHVVDASRDLTLAAISDPRALRRDTKFSLEVLGYVNNGDTSEILNAALGLYSPGANHASNLMATARRLVSASNQQIAV
jgi:predicted DNA-binding WGR domain protein